MRRMLKRAILFLLLGAIINFAVAWALAACGPFWQFPGTQAGFKSDYSWHEDVFEWWNENYPFPKKAEPQNPMEIPLSSGQEESADLVGSDSMGSIRAPGMDLVHVEARSKPTGRAWASRLSCGWPMISMMGARWTWRESDTAISTDKTQNGISIDVTPRTELQSVFEFIMGRRILPLRPLWPGFAINTIFYAAILWLLFAAPFQFRRYRRLKHGLCLKCAYPTGTSEVCTECGAQLPLPLGEGRGEGMRASK